MISIAGGFEITAEIVLAPPVNWALLLIGQPTFKSEECAMSDLVGKASELTSRFWRTPEAAAYLGLNPRTLESIGPMGLARSSASSAAASYMPSTIWNVGQNRAYGIPPVIPTLASYIQANG